MAVFVRAKRVTDPLDEKAKACICGRDHQQMSSQFSSGSEHDGEEDSDGRDLSDLVRSFLEDGAHEQQKPEDDSDSDRDPSRSELADTIADLLSPGNADSFVSVLRSRVSTAVEMFSACSLRSNKVVFRRNVMAFLRESGYNAGICKTKWESSGGLTAGNYEFIDVVRSSSDGFARQQRYIVDVDFAGEFEIARPTPQYLRLLQVLPRVYIGRSEEMKQIVRLLCEAAKKSLKSRDLLLPPWRKNRYMQSKWFSPYRRTVNLVPATVKSLDRFAVVQCRTVGFDAVTDVNGRFVLPATTRTR